AAVGRTPTVLVRESYTSARRRPIANLEENHYKRAVDVLVVDDAAAIRTRLRTMFGDVPGVASVHEAANLGEARRLLHQKTPGVIVLDLHLSTESGLELLKELKSGRPDLVVIVLTNAVTDHH